MAEWYENEGFWDRIHPVLFSPERLARAADEIDQLITLTGVDHGRALDLCCGPGRHAVPLAKRGFDVTGVDLSKSTLDRARAAAKDAGVEVEWV